MKEDYRNPLFRQLRDELVKTTPPEQRFERTRRAENLLAYLNPSQRYPYEYFHVNITDDRPARQPNPSVSVEDARHDIPRLVEDVSSSINIPVETIDERVLTADDLSKMFNVSRKTVSRWRQRGLVGRRFVVDGRKRLGFLKSSVDRFVRRNSQQVSRSARFSRLTDTERRQIIEGARRLVRPGVSASDVIKQLADETSRSVETIRYTIKDFDKRNPERAVFADAGALDEPTKEKIYELYRDGASIRSLAKRFRRTEKLIRRVVGQMRVSRILALSLDYMPSPEFEEPDAEQTILGPMPESPKTQRTSRAAAGLPSYLASLYEVPLLTAEQEVYLFRKYNFLKFRAAELHSRLDPQRPRSRVMDQFERLYDEAVATKNQIIRANLRLVVSIAKRYVSDAGQLFDLISDGNEALMRAVEKFDYTRGFKFSTYASWAIKKNFARRYTKEMKHRDRFRTGPDEAFDDEPEYRADPHEQLRAQQIREAQVGKILDRLPDRERQIIVSRFGLTPGEEPKTLQQVGAGFGVSKERIRQLEKRAMSMLREAARVEKIEAPETA